MKGHTIKSNARRAARKAGLDCDTLDFVQGEDGLWRWHDTEPDEGLREGAVARPAQPNHPETERTSESFPGEAGQTCEGAAASAAVACAAGERTDAALSPGRVRPEDMRAAAEALLRPSGEPRVGGRRNKEKALCEDCESMVESGEGRQKLGDDNRYDIYCCDCYAARFPAGASHTAAGEAAAGSCNSPAAAALQPKPDKPKPDKPKPDKLGLLVEMLRRPNGLTLSEGAEATGWKAWTVRGRLSDLGRKHGLAIAKAFEDGRGNVYRESGYRNTSGGPDATLGANQ